ncbi:armadillo-type protein [Paraphysoderma sedebokerense]|nr:armadillo-type protein [Paraphysoderma sedebokerense]
MLQQNDLHPIDPVSLNVADVKSLILLLRSPDPTLCSNVLIALTKQAESGTKIRNTLINLGVIPSLLDLIKSVPKESPIRKNAVACIAATSELSEIPIELRAKELIDTLISLLNATDLVEVQEEAAFAVANISKDYSNKVEVRKAGGVKALTSLLASEDPDVKKNSSYALSILSEDFTNRAEIRQHNGLEALINLCGSEYPEIQENCLMALIHCAEDNENRMEIRRLNGLKKLLDILSPPFGPLPHQLALLCIAHCLEDGVINNSLSDYNGIAIISNCVTSDDAKIKQNASFALSVAAKCERNALHIRESAALSWLMNCLSHSDPSVIAKAALAITSIAKWETNHNDIAKLNIIDILVQRLADEDLEIKKNCVAAISSCCANAKLRQKLRSINGIEKIVNLLGSTDDNTCANAAECICNLSVDVLTRGDTIRFGAVKYLIPAISKPNYRVQNVASMALANLAHDVDARRAIKESNGVEHLVNLLSSKDAVVRRNAAWALSNTSAMSSIATEACRLGAIDKLVALSKVKPKHCKFAADALDRLLNYHPSAKYHVTNALSSGNRIDDGFYDIGALNTSLGNVPPFPTLSDLKAVPVNAKREIILVDSTNDENLCKLIESAISIKKLNTKILSNHDDIGLVRLLVELASLVTTGMGGPVKKERYRDLGYNLQISELKMALKSNVIPIGMIKAGTFYHRALLFKVLVDKIAGIRVESSVGGDDSNSAGDPTVRQADQTPISSNTPTLSTSPTDPSIIIVESLSGNENRVVEAGNYEDELSCSLSRGDYNRAWNVVLVKGEAVGVPGKESVPVIVDLMYEPGRLLVWNSVEANAYIRN